VGVIATPLALTSAPGLSSSSTSPWTPVRLAKRFGVGLRDVGVIATPHQLRHWFGSTLYVQTHDLRLV